MMDDEQERLEAGLRRTPPAAVPPELMERLRSVVNAPPAARAVHRHAIHRVDWLAGWRVWLWAAPAAAMILVWIGGRSTIYTGKAQSAAGPAAEPNAVQVGHSLVASFDEVAQVPGGEPVRFHCREWQDDVVIHDDAHGMVISRSTPRVEVIPVRFETY